MALSTEFLLADVGGTGTRLRVAGTSAPSPVREYTNSQYRSFADIVADYCAALGRVPNNCAIAAAGPVRQGQVQMTNLNWTLAEGELRATFKFARVVLVNDFAALAWATGALAGSELHVLSAVAPAMTGNRVVLGPGTGLGVAALLDAGASSWRAVTGEGGHVTLPACTAEERQLTAAVAAEFGHCSAERLLSGPGLSALTAGLGYGAATPAGVSAWAHAGDERGVHVVKVFAELLATVAADLALTFDASGGVYLAGGILPKLGATFPAAIFLQRFLDKGRMGEQLVNIPVAIITCRNPALRGLERMLEIEGF